MAALTHPPSKLFVLAAFILIVLTQICNAEYQIIWYSGNVPVFYNGTKIFDDGQYFLEFKHHCRLKIYEKKTHALTWTSNSRENVKFCACVFEGWGNLEIVSDKGMLWKAVPDQPKQGSYVLILKPKGDLAIHGPALWATATNNNSPDVLFDDRKSVMYSGDNLNPGESLVYGNYSLKMQTDCNLVFYDDKTPIWSSETSGKSTNCVCKFQYDANLVVYRKDKYGDEEPIWASKSNHDKQGNYLLVLQKDRNLVIYDIPIWHSKSDDVNAKPSLKAKVDNSTTTDAITQPIGIAAVV